MYFRFILWVSACLLWGCGDEQAGDGRDCRNNGRGCTTGFRCQLNASNAYECLEDLTPAYDGEIMPPDVLAHYDTLEWTNVDESEVILPNGAQLDRWILGGLSLKSSHNSADGVRSTQRTVMERKNDAIARMLTEARRYVCRGRRGSDVGEDDVEGNICTFVGTPAQIGYAYVFGGKTPDARIYPPYGDCSRDTRGDEAEALYGLDCSGLIYVAAQSAGIRINKDHAYVTKLSQVETWAPALVANPNLTHLKVEKIEIQDKNDLNQFEVGDMIMWGGHTAIVQKVGRPDAAGLVDEVVVIQSNGWGMRPTETTIENECTNNNGNSRGVRPLQYASMIQYVKAWNTPKYIMRLVVDLKGSIEMKMRCRGQEMAQVEISFPINTSGGQQDIDVVGRGTDYTGNPLEVTLRGRFEPATSLLSGSLYWSVQGDDTARVDAFEYQVLKANGEWFVLNNIRMTDESCVLEAQILFQE